MAKLTATTYPELHTLLTSKRDRAARIGNNTSAYLHNDGTIQVYLHRTPIVTFYPDEPGSVTIQTGGYNTVTTRERINQFLRPTGAKVYQQAHRLRLAAPGADGWTWEWSGAAIRVNPDGTSDPSLYLSDERRPRTRTAPAPGALPEPAPEPEPFDVVDFVIRFEGDELTEDEAIAGFQHLINSGQVWHLQGSYGRAAAALIEAGYCTPA